MHITGAMGSVSLREWAVETGQEIGWASNTPGSKSGLDRDGYEPGILQVHQGGSNGVILKHCHLIFIHKRKESSSPTIVFDPMNPHPE